MKLGKIASGLALSILCGAWLTQTVAAERTNAAADGLRIAQEAKKYAGGFEHFTSKMKMVLRNRDGSEAVRSMRIKVLETKSDGDKSLVVFDLPRDVTGTMLLTYTHRTSTDDQWLYLPALKRVKRIAADGMSGPFMGSEFSYEDIASQEVEKYKHAHVGVETVDGQSCDVLDQVPIDSNSGYSKRRVWIDQQAKRTLKVEFFNRRGEREKTLISKDFKKFLDHQWRPLASVMTNHLSGKSTRLEFSEFDFGAELSDADFNAQRMQSGR